MNPHLKNVKRKWLNWSWNSHLNFSKQKMHTRSKCIIRHSRKRLPIFDIWRDYKFKWTWETYLGPNKSICHTKQERATIPEWIRAFLGINYIMSIAKLPNVKCYWSVPCLMMVWQTQWQEIILQTFFKT